MKNSKVKHRSSTSGAHSSSLRGIPHFSEPQGSLGLEEEGWAVWGMVQWPAGGCDVLWGGNAHSKKKVPSGLGPGVCTDTGGL